MTITHDEFNAALSAWAKTMDLDFTDRDNRKRDAHVTYLKAQDAYFGVTMADAMIKMLYPELAAPAPLPEGRFEGRLTWYGKYGYIYATGFVNNLRVTRKDIMGSRAIRTYEQLTVTFSLSENEAMGYMHACRVVIIGDDDSEAAYARRTTTPSNPVQRQPRNLQEAREQAAERKTAGRVPRISVPPLLSGDKAMRDAAYADYMDRFYEADAQEDSSMQQQIDVRSDL